MPSPDPAAVLILAADDTSARRWKASLDAAGLRVWLGSNQRPEDARLDVILTDQPIARQASASACRQLARGDVAVVAVGRGGPADVVLPCDASGREIVLACRLLAEVSRLRRRVRRQARLRRALERLAATDSLTGVANRRAWDEQLFERSRGAEPASTGQTLCLAILDLDHFKRVNDERGYAAGDALLRSVGELLGRQVHPPDFVARLGGDEFGLLLTRADATAVAAAVDALRRAIPLGLVEAGHPAVTASAGYAVHLGAETAEPAGLLAAADRALRAAKECGRDQLKGACIG